MQPAARRCGRCSDLLRRAPRVAAARRGLLRGLAAPCCAALLHGRLIARPYCGPVAAARPCCGGAMLRRRVLVAAVAVSCGRFGA